MTRVKKIKNEAEKIRSFLVHKFRQAWFFYSEKRRACIKSKQCAVCHVAFERQKDVHADHINPVIDPATGFIDWNTYYDRMMNGELQPLCKTCHDIKTSEERKRRTANGIGKAKGDC